MNLSNRTWWLRVSSMIVAIWFVHSSAQSQTGSNQTTTLLLEGRVSYQAISEDGVQLGHIERDFRVYQTLKQVLIRVSSNRIPYEGKIEPVDYCEIGSDGTNWFKLIVSPDRPNATNYARGGGTVEAGLFPRFDSYLFSPIWLAYCSGYSVSTNLVATPAVWSTASKEEQDLLYRAEIMVRAEVPHLPERITIFEDTRDKRGDRIKGFLGSPKRDTGKTNVLLTTSDVRRISDLNIPARFQLLGFARRAKTGNGDYVYLKITGELTNASSTNISFEGKPRLGFKALISDKRFQVKTHLLTPIYLATDGWIVDTNDARLARTRAEIEAQVDRFSAGYLDTPVRRVVGSVLLTALAVLPFVALRRRFGRKGDMPKRTPI